MTAWLKRNAEMGTESILTTDTVTDTQLTGTITVMDIPTERMVTATRMEHMDTTTVTLHMVTVILMEAIRTLTTTETLISTTSVRARSPPATRVVLPVRMRT
jgi:hypothetical protein